MPRREFRPLRRATKGAAFGNRELLKNKSQLKQFTRQRYLLRHRSFAKQSFQNEQKSIDQNFLTGFA